MSENQTCATSSESALQKNHQNRTTPKKLKIFSLMPVCLWTFNIAIEFNHCYGVLTLFRSFIIAVEFYHCYETASHSSTKLVGKIRRLGSLITAAENT